MSTNRHDLWQRFELHAKDKLYTGYLEVAFLNPDLRLGSPFKILFPPLQTGIKSASVVEPYLVGACRGLVNFDDQPFMELPKQ